MYQLFLCRMVLPANRNKCLEYDIKLPGGNDLVILDLWGIWSTLSLASLPGLLLPGMVAPDRVLSVGQKEMFDI